MNINVNNVNIMCEVRGCECNCPVQTALDFTQADLFVRATPILLSQPFPPIQLMHEGFVHLFNSTCSKYLFFSVIECDIII